MNSTGLKAWKGLKASSDTTILKGESMPHLHELKPATVEPVTVQSCERTAVDAQKDAQTRPLPRDQLGQMVVGRGVGLEVTELLLLLGVQPPFTTSLLWRLVKAAVLVRHTEVLAISALGSSGWVAKALHHLRCWDFFQLVDDITWLQANTGNTKPLTCLGLFLARAYLALICLLPRPNQSWHFFGPSGLAPLGPPLPAGCFSFHG